MPKVIYIEHDGTQHEVDVPVGENIMHGALYNGVPGIVGECGGALSCATCRCLLEDVWAAKTGGPATHEERELLDSVAELDTGEDKKWSHRRLSCQIVMSRDLEGLTVHLPEKQYL